MNRKIGGILGALLVGSTVFGGLVLTKPVEAAPRRRVIRARPAPYSRYRTNQYPYYRNGRWYSTRSTRSVPRKGQYGDLDRDGVLNKWDRDRDGDGRRNNRDRHPSDRRRR